jgi:hypothetical protein
VPARPCGRPCNGEAPPAALPHDTDEAVAFFTALELMHLSCDGQMSVAAKTFTARRYNGPRYRARVDNHLAAMLGG